MQIRELTQKKQIELEEGISSEIGDVAGQVVSGVKNVGSAIASPFKDVAQGYRSARQDQKVSALADKAFRIWQNYVAQVEQSIAKQPATVAPKADATKDAVAPGAPANTMANVPVSKTNKAAPGNPNATPAAPTTAPAATTTTTTTTAKPNYGTQTGAGAKVTYKQPTGVPNPLAKNPQATSPNMMQPPAKTPATVASTAPGQTITVGGQKLKPGTKEYDQIAKATLKELQAPVSPALQAFRDRTDGKYEAYLTAFVQKNLLAGMGFKGLVNQQEITNAIKAIAAPANADPAKQRPLWNDLARATSLAVPAAGALTGRDPKASKDPNAPATTEPGSDDSATTEPAKPTMTRDQISQWISRNSEDPAALKAALDAINAVKG
jgi:hypothetical protein